MGKIKNLIFRWKKSITALIKTFDYSSQTVGASGIYFRSDGLKYYIIGADTDGIHEYNMSVSWDITTSSFLQNLIIGAPSLYQPNSIFFSSDGTKMYIPAQALGQLQQYTLSVAWDVTTATIFQTVTLVSLGLTEGFALSFSDDGTKMYMKDTATADIRQYTVGTAWDINTAVYLQTFTPAVNTMEISFNVGGTKMYLLDNNNREVKQYNLSTAWDITTAVYTTFFDVENGASYMKGFRVGDGESKLYTTGFTTNIVQQYSI